jgi:hypothetical protein
MELIYSNTLGDIYYFRIRWMMRNPIVIILSLALLSFIGFSTFRRLEPGQYGISVKIGMVALQILLWLGFLVAFYLVGTLLLVLHLRWKSKREEFYCEHKLRLDHENITETTLFSTSIWKWKNVYSVSQDKRFIFIYLTPDQAYVIPKRAIQTNATSVFDELRESWKRSKEPDSADPATDTDIPTA